MDLPEDVLADVLRGVAPRDLAACRCACKYLRAVIDSRRLLRADLLPLSVDGIFINFHNTVLPEFFARPTTGPAISGRLEFLPHPGPRILDRRRIEHHCNGLLLIADDKDCYVVNPATRQWDALPPHPQADPDFAYQKYLVFDPMVSPHYEVFTVPRPSSERKAKPEDFGDKIVEECEWPPSVLALHVFSSRSSRLEERSFVRHGEAAWTVGDMRRYDCHDKHYAVYYRSALYVHCKTDNLIMRICLLNDTYEVIKPPMGAEINWFVRKVHLGRSKKGVYLASIRYVGRSAYTSNSHRLTVWVLEESCGQKDWALKHNNCLTPMLGYDRPVLGPWVLEDINLNEYLKEYNESGDPPGEDIEQLLEKMLELKSGKEHLLEEYVEWDSENDDVLHNKFMVCGRCDGKLDILGFHPYEEIIYLHISLYRGLAYHLKDSNVHDLGYLYPTTYHITQYDQFIIESFPYPPCWTGHQKATEI